MIANLHDTKKMTTAVLLGYMKNVGQGAKIMIFKEYIEALSNTGFFGKNKARIGIMLFDASTTADPKVIPSESTIKNGLVQTGIALLRGIFRMAKWMNPAL